MSTQPHVHTYVYALVETHVYAHVYIRLYTCLHTCLCSHLHVEASNEVTHGDERVITEMLMVEEIVPAYGHVYGHAYRHVYTVQVCA